MIRRLMVILLCAVLLPLTTVAAVELRQDRPFRYVVQPGDTLWGIASRFLKQPWQWQELWRGNPQITYPYDLYVGDVIELHLLNGKPTLSVSHSGTIKLSPQMRVMQLEQPIPTIPIELIKPFLDYSGVFDKKTLLKAPYIVAMEGEHISGGEGTNIFARSIFTTRDHSFNIYRLEQKPYRDPVTKAILGYQGTFIGRADLIKPGDPATLNVIRAPYNLMNGDRLLAESHVTFSRHFMMHAPNMPVNAHIIGVLGEGISQIGRFNTVVIDRGRCDGITVGDVLSVYRVGDTIIDPIYTKHKQRVTLPDELAGQLMIYRTFDFVSYGLVMDSIIPMHIFDKATNPDEGSHGFEPYTA